MPDFNNAQKNTWRNWEWRQIVHLLPEFADRRDPPNPASATTRAVTSRKVVLYLAGEQDLDRQVAKRWGFLDANLIAVDRDSDALKRINGPKLKANLNSALIAWPSDRTIDVIVADFFCGLTCDDVIGMFIACMASAAFPIGTVFSCNMLRGRSGCLAKEWREVVAKSRHSSLATVHRGSTLLQILGYMQIICMYGGNAPENWDEIADDCERFAKPRMNSYKSRGDSGNGNLYYDSVVFRQWMQTVGHEYPGQANLKHAVGEILGIDDKSVRAVTRSIAAVNAHRTRGTYGMTTVKPSTTCIPIGAGEAYLKEAEGLGVAV